MMTHVGMDRPAALGGGGGSTLAVSAGAAAGCSGGVATGDAGDWNRLKAAAPTSLCPKLMTRSKATQANTNRTSLDRTVGDRVCRFTFSSSSLDCLRSWFEGRGLGVFEFTDRGDGSCILDPRDCEPLTPSDARHYNRFGRFCQLRVTLGATHSQERVAAHLPGRWVALVHCCALWYTGWRLRWASHPSAGDVLGFVHVLLSSAWTCRPRPHPPLHVVFSTGWGEEHAAAVFLFIGDEGAGPSGVGCCTYWTNCGITLCRSGQKRMNDAGHSQRLSA